MNQTLDIQCTNMWNPVKDFIPKGSLSKACTTNTADLCASLDSNLKDIFPVEISKLLVDLCPNTWNSCKSTVCEGSQSVLTLSCEEINRLFTTLMQSKEVLELLNSQLAPDFVVTNFKPCQVVQVLTSMGIDILTIFTDELVEQLKARGLQLKQSDYVTIVSCACPEALKEQTMNCNNLVQVTADILDQPYVQKKLKEMSNIEITSSTKCDILQQISDTGVNLEDFIYTQLAKKIGNSKNLPSKDKIKQAINCICPELKPYNKPEPTPNNNKVTYNKLNIAVLSIITFVVMFVLFTFILLFINAKLSKKLKILLLLIVVSIAGILLTIQLNPKCLFKYCITSGDDWVPVDGTFSGSKQTLSTTVDINMTIDMSNKVILNTFNCEGDLCPYNNLLDKCSDHTLIIGNEKSVYGYELIGECIDELYKIQNNGKQVIFGVWLVQQDNQLTINIGLDVPPVGKTFITIPLVKNV
jgi:urease gamma subunit